MERPGFGHVSGLVRNSLLVPIHDGSHRQKDIVVEVERRYRLQLEAKGKSAEKQPVSGGNEARRQSSRLMCYPPPQGSMVRATMAGPTPNTGQAAFHARQRAWSLYMHACVARRVQDLRAGLNNAWKRRRRPPHEARASVPAAISWFFLQGQCGLASRCSCEEQAPRALCESAPSCSTMPLDRCQSRRYWCRR